jgi:hypothetical protein
MRVGSQVSIGISTEDGDCEVPKDAPVGTVIGLQFTCECDGYEDIIEIAIRWANGRVENRKPIDDTTEVVDVTPKCYANLYLFDRAYGGPEEGGWWYDTYAPVDGDWIDDPPAYGHFESEALAEAALLLLEIWCKEQNSTRRSPSSMASDGHFVAMLEAWPAEFKPRNRPYYC